MVHGTVRSLFQLLGAVAMTIVVVAGWLAFRLAEQPLPLTFLTPYIEDALTSSDGRVAVKLDDTVLVWNGSNRTLDVRAIGVQAKGADGSVVAIVPEMSVTLSGPALLRGAVVPRRLRLLRPTLHLTIDDQGRWLVGVGQAPIGQAPMGESPVGRGPGAAPGYVDQLKELLAVPGQLQRVDITGGDLTIEDQARRRLWHAPRADLSLRRDKQGVTGTLRVDLDIGSRLATLEGQSSFALNQRAIDLQLNFGGIDPSALAELAPVLAPAAGLHLDLSGTLRLRYELDLGVTDAGFDVKSGEGVIDVSSTLGASWPIAGAVLRGRWSPAGTAVDLFQIDLAGAQAELTGRIDTLGGGMAVTADARVDGVHIDDLGWLWPPAVARNPRAWVVANLSKGVVPWAKAHLAAHLPNGAPPGDLVVDSLTGELAAEGARVRYLDPMPPVANASAKAHFDTQAFVIDLTGGRVMDLQLEEGVVALKGLSDVDQFAEIALKVNGPVTDALRLIDYKPLGYARALGIEPARVQGDAVTHLELKFPLENNLTLERVNVRATSQVSHLAIPAVALGLDLQDGTVGLEVDTAGLDLSGTALLAGRPAKIKWRENFGHTAFRSRYQVSASLDEAGRKTVGLAFPPFQAPYMNGELPVDLVAIFFPGGRAEIDVKADLSPISLSFPGLNLVKPAGGAASGEAEIRLLNNQLAEIPRFAVSAAGGLEIEGKAAFEAGRIRSVTFGKGKWRHTDIRGVLAFDPAGLTLDLSGAGLDAREAVSGSPSDPVTDHAPPKAAERSPHRPPAKREEVVPLVVHARIGQLWVSDTGVLKEVAVDAARDTHDWNKAHIDARTVGGAPFSLDLQPIDGHHRGLKLSAADAGAVFRAFGVFENVVGGQLAVDGTYDDGDPLQPLTGLATVNDYQVLKAPALARLLTVAALTGIVEVLSGEGIHFQVLDLPFTLSDGVLQVHDARASGPSLGITAKGSMDLETDRLALEGTVVPVYLLNSALGKLPLVGSLFSAEKGGGVLAMNYSMKGPADDPSVSVNPLSALTPGFLRRLFDVFDDVGKSAEH